jgi:hypothetical protein
VTHPFHGPIHHLGYVADDIEATVARLVDTLGAGRFFVVRDVCWNGREPLRTISEDNQRIR